MRHSSSRDAANRHGNGMTRMAFQKADDTKVIQESKLNGYHEEEMDTIEHFHPYGFTAVPKEPTGEGDQQQSAEAMGGFLGHNRSHGIALVVGDRRFRLYKLEDGEVALHDDQGQQVHIKRDGVWASVPKSKKVIVQVMSDDTMPQDDSEGSGGTTQKLGQIKQAGRPVHASYTLDKDSFTVNHPVAINLNAPVIKCTASDHFSTVGNTRLGSDDADHNVYGKNGSVGMVSDKVFVKATLPGPPTSLDTEP